MTVATLILVATGFSFAGGRDSDLVTTVQHSTGYSIGYVFSPRRIWPKAGFDYSHPAELRSVLSRRYDLAFSSGDQANSPLSTGWSTGEYPGTFFYKQNLDSYSRSAPDLPTPKAGWPLTLRSAKTRYISVEQIERLCVKPLKVHWFFDEVRLVLDISNMDEEALLSLVAKAVGGKLIDQKSNWYIDIDPRVLRTRAEKLFADQANVARFEDQALDAKYMAALYETLSDGQLKRLYASASTEWKMPIMRNSELEQIAAERLWQRIGRPDAEESSLSPDKLAQRRAILPRIDFGQGFFAVVTPLAVPSCMTKGRSGDDWKLVY